MGVSFRTGPSGAVFVTDWSDTGECHSTRNTRKHTGRIFRISHGQPPHRPVNITELDEKELVRLQLHKNDWFVRHARRTLQERAAAGNEMSGVHKALHNIFNGNPDITRKLRAVWALHVTGGLENKFLQAQLGHGNEHIRAWVVTLLCEGKNPPKPAIKTMQILAAKGKSQLVRLHLASALQRIEPAKRWNLAEALIGRKEDTDDQNLPLMYWYGIESLVHEDLSRFVALAGVTKIPLLRQFITRRVAEK